MKTISRYIATLLFIVTATTLQGHKLSVIHTVGGNGGLIAIYRYGDYTGVYSTNMISKWDEEANGVSCEVAAGDSVQIYHFSNNHSGWAYAYMECDGKKIHERGSDYNDLLPDVVVFVMPDHDATIYVYATFDPDTPYLPDTPNGNSWNAATGELFISGFRPGNNIKDNTSVDFYTVAKQLGVKNEDVKKVTVMGEMGEAQISFGQSHVTPNIYEFPNVETIDLRHTYNYYYYYFNEKRERFHVNSWGTPNLKKIILPSDIKAIQTLPWKELPLMEEFVIYATVPPAIYFIGENYFDYIPDSCILYVPEQSIAAYKADENWGSRFADILPIPEGEAEDITVDMPDDFRDGRYVGMSLRLFNVQSGEETKYIVDERGSYIFRSMTCDEAYTAQLSNEKGVLVASTDTLTLDNRPLEMVFTNVNLLRDLTLQVQTPPERKNGNPTDVTEQTTIVWTDAIGNRIGTGNTLARQIDGTRLFYGIGLPAELAAHYGVPPRTELVVSATTAQTTVTLALPDTVILSGTVTDTDGQPIAMATVTASLMMNGTVGKTFIATTDLSGRYELTVLAGDITLSATARGYAVQRVAMMVDGSDGQKAIDPILLAPLSGPTIVYDFTYTTTPTPDGEATTTPGYSDYVNVAVAAYNETTGLLLDSLMVQYPEVQLLGGAKAGDRIRLTASSLKEAFMPVEVTVTLNDEERDTVTFALKELGGIEASFLQTDNEEVTVSLYDADGQLVGAYPFSEATMTLNHLPDGDYTLVMMGSNSLFSKMLSLKDYFAVGLLEDVDYVSDKVTVVSGVLAQVTNERVPTLNADPFYYTNEMQSSFMPNHTELTTSSNVTLRAEIGFKEMYKERVSNVRLLVDFPSEKAEFVEGSSMTGTKMVRATVEDGRVSIPVEREFIDDPVRFILTATDQGALMASAYVQFDINGREVIQPIGTATCEVKYMTIVAPEQTHKLQFSVRGDAPAFCPIKVYTSGDLLLGETKSMADGTWQMHVELPGCPNLAKIPLYAVVTTQQQREMKTETTYVTYDINTIRPLHVYMYPPLVADRWGRYNGISDQENLRIDFDFDQPETVNRQWYSAYVHEYHPFFFEIVLNTFDPSLVHDVVLEVLTVKGEVEYLKAEYDFETGHWMCHTSLIHDAVCNVDVKFVEEREVQLDAEQQFANTHWLEYYKELLTAFNNEVERIVTELGRETSVEKRKQLMGELAKLIGVGSSSVDIDADSDMTLEEVFASIEDILEEDETDVDEFIRSMDQYNMDFGEAISFSHAAGLDAQELLNNGYKAIKMTDESSMYELVEERHYVLVDFKNDLRMEVTGEAAEKLASFRRAPYQEDFLTMCNRKMGEIIYWWNILNATFGKVKKLAVDACLALQPMIGNLSTKIDALYKTYYAVGAPPVTEQQTKALVKLCTKRGLLENVHDAMSQMATDGLDVAKFAQKYEQLAPKTVLGKLMSGSLKVLNGLGQFFSYAAVLNDLKEGYDRVNELSQLWLEVPDPCEEDPVNASHLRNEIEKFSMYEGTYFIALAAADLSATEIVDKGVKAVAPTWGSSMSTVFGGITALLIKMGANAINDETYRMNIQSWTSELELLQCDEEYRKKQDKKIRARLRAEMKQNPHRDIQVVIDPSGYVYEAVADNRVENATATIYCKRTGEDEYGDQHDEVVKWNAEEYRQENPLLTDADGRYAWDVPQGLWQVKIEKDGYNTAYSDWLPVPPPQLDINIPLVRNTLPDVQSARAYEDGVEVTFNEYMRPQTLTADRILLSQNGQPLTCHIEQQDRGRAYNSDDTYASRIKVRTESSLANGSKVQLTVRRQVEAYNGLQMQNDYQQDFTVVREVYAIGTDSIVEVARNGERTITVCAFPAQAAQGMKVTARTMIGAVATVTGEATFDANGEAVLTVLGKAGGQTALLLGLENSKVKAQSVIWVEDPSLLPVYAPTASRISGTYVSAGEQVTLHTDTEGATIWYTTDGTCPCDENGTRKKYTGPIAITEAVTLRAYAVKGDDASRVVTFDYKIYDPVGIGEAAASDGKVPMAYYAPDGQRLLHPRKGVHIVRYTDGTTRKVNVK